MLSAGSGDWTIWLNHGSRWLPTGGCAIWHLYGGFEYGHGRLVQESVEFIMYIGRTVRLFGSRGQPSGQLPGIDWRDDAYPVLQRRRGIQAQVLAVTRADHLD